MSRLFRPGSATLLLCLLASNASAQQDIATMSLQDLLGAEVVSSASKFPQEVREAPASITVITAEDMRRQGHRSLADVLRSARGLYTTYDRNYEYVGVRGFSRPGDYNTRVLLLLDGHRLNDGIYDMAPIGADFPVDISLIDRVEIIRGPSSSLYGTSAFFAVINVVTRTGGQRKGLGAEAYAGSLSTRGANVSFGRLFERGDELLVAASGYRSSGAESLYFPEFADDPTGGLAARLDGDESSKVFGSYAHGRISVRGGMGYRNKSVPTASFATVFGDAREATIDTRGFMNLVFDGPVAHGWLATARLAYDYYTYSGTYPYDYGDGVTALSQDLTQSHTAGGEVTARRRFARVHLFSAGVEVRNQFRAHQYASDGFDTVLSVNKPGTIIGLYAQDEMRVRSWLIVNGGVRLDRYPTFGNYAAPRVGVVVLPRSATAIKLLRGKAFRAPNAYELYYFDAMQVQPGLEPENITSTELVWEEYVSKNVRTTLTVFNYDAEEIIEQRSHAATTGSDDLYFANSGDVVGRGIETEIETRLPRGFMARASHAYARVRDHVSGSAVSNSPAHLGKFSVQVPVGRFYVATEGQFVGERRTLAGDRLESFFVPAVTLTSPADRKLDFTLSVYNALNTSYADPGGEEHTQRVIPQDGRTMLARFRVRF
jgi:outer membrane receptor for ferrienterochelin and colicins